MPMGFPVHYSRCSYALYRMVVTDDPACDRSTIPNIVDIMGAFERWGAVLGAIPANLGLETNGRDIFSQSSRMTKTMAPVWSKVMEEAGIVVAMQNHANAASMELERELELMGGMGDPMELFSWWDTL
jgi:hypothetical protein